MSKQELQKVDVQAEDKPVKKRGQGGKYNFPNTVEPEDPEIVRAALSNCMRWYTRGENKATTVEDIRSRTIEFFQTCIYNGERPTVEKYCLALGTIRQRVNEWEHLSDERADLIKRAKEYIASFDAELAVAGKLNPVLYFFRAKNYYGMRDQTEITVEPRAAMTIEDAATVAARYQEALPDE